MRNKKVILPLLVLLVAGVTAATILNNRTTVERREDQPVAPLVRIRPVALEDVALTVRGQGNAIPAAEANLVAQVAGQIESAGRAFAAGGVFRRGEVLLRLDKRDYQLSVAQAEATVAQAQVRLDRERAEAELARAEWQELGLGDPTPLASRQPQLAEAEAAVAAAGASLERARLDLSRTVIRAPFDGVLRRKLVDLGQRVAPGTPLAEIFSTAYLEVPLPVTQPELAFLDLDWEQPNVAGPAVSFRATIAGREHLWRGQIVRIGSEIDPLTRMMTLHARIDERLSESAGQRLPLPVGSYLDAAIEGRRVTGVAVLPRTAVRDGSRVLVVDGDGRLRFRDVEILRLEHDRALIASGLEAGEQVCISQLEAPVDGMLVRTLAESPRLGESPEFEERL